MTEITLDWLNDQDNPFPDLCLYINSYEEFEEVFNLVCDSDHEDKLNVFLADEFPEFYSKYSIEYGLIDEDEDC